MKPAPSPAAADAVDLRFAARELEEARAALAAAHELVEPRARREAVKAAIGKLALASRAIDEVISRRTS